MELIGLLSKVVKENVKTKKILLEYPESTVKKLVDKFTKQSDDTEDQIRQVIADFERFKAAFSSQDRDIFRHSYDKVKSLVKDKSTTQQTKKDLEGLTQDYINKWRETVQVDLQQTKTNIKKFFEVKTQLPTLQEFKKDILTYSPPELQSLVNKHFNKVNTEGLNTLIVTIAQKFHDENPQMDVMTEIIPRAKKFVKYFDRIPLNSKLTKTMTFDEFEHLIDGHTPMEGSEYDLPEIDTSNVDVAYEDDEILIFAPDEKQKCINIRMKYAPDRTWCTSWDRAGNLYYNYRLTKNLTLYYIIQKNLPESDLNYASVILVDKYGGMRLADGSNRGTYSGHEEISWNEILKKIPTLEGKKDYLVPKPYNDADMEKLSRYKNYNLSTTDPIAELGGIDEVEMWMDQGPDFSTMGENGAIIFGNLPDELQRKYISLGNELSGLMVRKLSPGAMTYYLARKKERLLQKQLSQLTESDIELILSDEMRPYAKKLKEKYTAELDTKFDPETITIKYPTDPNGKYVRMYGLREFLNILPKDTQFLQFNNTSNTPIDWEVPEEIGNFTELFSLHFENCIKSLPETISNLSSLQFLNVPNNTNLTTLPEALGDMPCIAMVVTGGSPITFDSLPEKVKKYYTLEGDGVLAPFFPPEMTENCLISFND